MSSACCACAQVIVDICNANAIEIAGFVSDMHSMQDGAANIQQLLVHGNQVLQVSHSPVLHPPTLTQTHHNDQWIQPRYSSRIPSS